jgi:hypothetical protein
VSFAPLLRQLRVLHNKLSLGVQLARPLLCSTTKIDSQFLKETHMNTLSTKLGAVAAALLMNGLIMSAVGYLFALQAQPHLSAIAFAHKVVAHQWV